MRSYTNQNILHWVRLNIVSEITDWKIFIEIIPATRCLKMPWNVTMKHEHEIWSWHLRPNLEHKNHIFLDFLLFCHYKNTLKMRVQRSLRMFELLRKPLMCFFIKVIRYFGTNSEFVKTGKTGKLMWKICYIKFLRCYNCMEMGNDLLVTIDLFEP